MCKSAMRASWEEESKLHALTAWTCRRLYAKPTGDSPEGRTSFEIRSVDPGMRIQGVGVGGYARKESMGSPQNA